MKKYNLLHIAIGCVVLIGAYFLIKKTIFRLEGFGQAEGFGATSPGTLVQLVSSHVPTQEDVDYYTKAYPKVVRREIANMTGSDPGNVALYPF